MVSNGSNKKLTVPSDRVKRFDYNYITRIVVRKNKEPLSSIRNIRSIIKYGCQRLFLTNPHVN